MYYWMPPKNINLSYKICLFQTMDTVATVHSVSSDYPFDLKK